MKHILKSECPEGLAKYLKDNPDGTWDNFSDEAREAYKIVQDIIKDDQLGICCYCETDFDISEQSYIKDFRVEHFYPKSKTLIRDTKKNAHLTWSNLLGCCHGGSKNHIDDDRYTSPNLHCDAIKNEHDWTQVILNPLTIAEDARIFTFDKDGSIKVSDQCPDEIKVLAQQSIDKLNLNEETYLLKARGKVRAELVNQYTYLVKDGKTPQQALDILKQALFSETATNMKFYTCKLDYVSY